MGLFGESDYEKHLRETKAAQKAGNGPAPTVTQFNAQGQADFNAGMNGEGLPALRKKIAQAQVEQDRESMALRKSGFYDQ